MASKTAGNADTQFVEWNESKCRTISGSGGHLVKMEGQIYYGSSSGGLCEYIETNDEWRVMPSVGVWEFGLGVCNGKLFVVGGRNCSISATRDILYFEDAGRRWRQGTPMIQECKHPTVISIRSGLVVMGETFGGGLRVQVFVSDEGHGRWYYGKELPAECKDISSTCHNDDVVFINKAHSKSVWYASIQDLIQADSSSTPNKIWTPIKDIPNCSALLSIYNGVLLAIGGRKEPNMFKSVYAYSFNSQEWSYISTMPHECCHSDTAALAIPETQELMLVQASRRLLMRGRVRDYDSYMNYKISTLPQKGRLQEGRVFQLLLDVASKVSTINDWNQMKNNLGIIDNDCMAGCSSISNAESYRNILFMWWKNHGSDTTINHVLTELERINPEAARRIRAQYQEDIGGELLPGETINDHSLQVSEFFSQLMKINQCQTMGIWKPTGLLTSEPPANQPTMPQLICFSDRKLNIAAEIGDKYLQFGILLLEDKSGAVTKGLEMEHLKNPELINIAILQKWLDGKGAKPRTWSTLVDTLRCIQKKELADAIESLLPPLPLNQPTMPQLICFSDRKLNIAAEIGDKYLQFGILLLEDKSGAVTKSLEMEHQKNAEVINIAILQKWLDGKGAKPRTWSTLVDTLRCIQKEELADAIESLKSELLDKK